MKVGLYFGSFNPIHIGHLIVAQSMLEKIKLDEIWFVISPQSPFKKKYELAPDNDRKAMVELAIKDNKQMKANIIEFGMPHPSYTIYTLESLHRQYPDNEFSMIMGADNLIDFDKWKRYKDILNLVDIHIYTRKTENAIPEKWKEKENIFIHQLPLINVSSTSLRNNIKADKTIKYWVQKEVEAYILKHKLYA